MASPAFPRSDRLATDVESITREAGEIALRFARDGARTWRKDDASPVTEADLAVDRFLASRLSALDPASGWLSEETADTPDRLGRERVWIVDPIDGTRAFVEGISTWVISVALVEGTRPVIGAVFNPTRGEMFVAVEGAGATLNGAPLHAGDPPALADATVAGPRGAMKILDGVAFTRGERIHSLAYRVVSVAAGWIDAAIAGERAHDWDIAAADLILAESGAQLVDMDGGRPRYNEPEPVHRLLVAAREPLSGALRQAMRRATASTS